MMTQPLAGLLALVCLSVLSPCAQGASSERALLAASGVPQQRVSQYQERLVVLAAEFESQLGGVADETDRVKTLHRFLHEQVLRGHYLASASDVGRALDGGPFNCVAATILLRMLCERTGLSATAMATRGHVWCRVTQADGTSVDIESTCPDWFAIAEKYRGIPTARVSTAMAAHRRRIATGRELSDRELLAVLEFNRGVTHIQASRFAEAAFANMQAISLDPECRPAWENLAAVARQLPSGWSKPTDSYSWLISWSMRQALDHYQDALAAK